MTAINHLRPSKPFALKFWHVIVGLVAAFVLAGVADVSVIIAGIIYVPFLILLTIWKREVGMALAFSLAPFVNDLAIGGPVHVSIGEFSLMLIFVLCVASQLNPGGKFRMGPVFIPVLIYLTCCLISTAANWNLEAITPLVQMMVYLVCAVFVFSSFCRSPERLVVVLDLAIVVSAILAIGALVTDYGFLHINKNSWGASMGTAAVIAAERWLATNNRRRRRLITIGLVLIVVCLFFSLSRGGWLSAIAGIFVILAMRGKFRTLFKLAALLVPLVTVMWFALPAQLQSYAIGLDSSRRNIEARWSTIDAAESLFVQHPLLGVGIQLRKEMDSTDLAMVTLAETGVQGLLAFIAIHVTVLVMVWRDRRRLNSANPMYSMLVLGGALIMARMAHGMVDHYWSRGAILQAWSAVGMATAVHYAIKRPPRHDGAARHPSRLTSLRKRYRTTTFAVQSD